MLARFVILDIENLLVSDTQKQTHTSTVVLAISAEDSFAGGTSLETFSSSRG